MVAGSEPKKQKGNTRMEFVSWCDIKVVVMFVVYFCVVVFLGLERNM